MNDKAAVKLKLERGEYHSIAAVSSFKFTSGAWKYFERVVDAEEKLLNFAQCKSCKDIVPYSHKSGTNGLNRHKCSRLAEPNLRITGFINSSAMLPASVKEKFGKACAIMVAQDIRPYNIVAGSGFLNLVQTAIDISASFGKVSASDLVPHRSTVASKTRELANVARETLLKLVKENVDFWRSSMTLDLWCDDYRKISYLTITLHYIDRDWCQTHERVLCTSRFDMEKTGENILSEVKRLTKEFGFNSLKEVVFVSDRGANVVAALRGEQRLSCAAHMLNTVLTHTFKAKNLKKAGLEEIDVQLSCCRDLVTYFKRSSLMAKLDTGLQQLVATRWNSHFSMLVSVSKNFETINQVLPPQELHRANCIKIEMVNDLIRFLAPFKEATDILEASRKPTLHRVIPQWRNLLVHLEPKSSDITFIGNLKELARFYMDSKFKTTQLHRLALFLNPKMRSLKACYSEEDRDETLADVRRLVSDVYSGSDDRQNDHVFSVDADKEAKKRKVNYVMNEQCWEDDNDIGEDLPAAHTEIDSYKNIPIAAISNEDFDLLSWWKTNEKSLPRLSKVARYILAIPASSAASERNFSAAGLTVDKLRSKISPKNVDDLLFLKSNSDLIA